MTCNDIIANLKGIFSPVVTPFNRRGGVDFGKFRAYVNRLTGAGLGGILVAGSTGEAPYLTEGERLRLVEVARRLVRPPEVLMVGTGLEGTGATLRLSREVIARGTDVVLVVTPNYYKSRMDGDALVAHYRAVAAGVRRPVLVYSIPQFTGIRMAPETIGRLSRLPNVAGLKESSGDLSFVLAVLKQVRPGFRVLVGSVSILLEALQAGAVGAVLSQANFVPELCAGVYESFRRGQLKTAQKLQQRLLPLARQIAVPYGVPGIKAAVDLCGFHAGPPRPPLLPVSAAVRREIAAVLRACRAGLDF